MIEITPSNNPTPDPAWDYAQIWDMLQANRMDLEQLLTYLGSFENSTPGTDFEIKKRLRTLSNSFEVTLQLLDK